MRLGIRRRLGRLLTAPMRWAWNSLPTRRVENLIQRVVTERADRLPPDEALRFLFRLDAQLYALEGRKAVAYGGGTHTKHRHMAYHDFFVHRIHPGERVIDIGCGMGALAHSIASRAGAHVVGIDISAPNIEQARRQNAHERIEYRLGDALEGALEGHFDAAVLSNVLEHLPARPEFLRRVQEVVRPARLLIRVPLFEREWRVPLKRELGVEWRLDLTHETEYTLESFAEEMDAAGLQIIHQEIRWGEVWAEVAPRD